MAIPEQIRKQTEAVQKLYAELNSDEGGTESVVEEQTGDPSAHDENTQPQSQGNADDNTGVGNVAPSSERSEQKSGDENSESDENVLQKYRTLQGMYNSEVPRLHRQNREMQQRIQQMEQLLASLQSSKPTQDEEVVAEKLVSEQDVSEYGESIDVMRKVSREELYPVASRISRIEQMLQQLQTSVVPQVNNLAQRQHMSAEQQFWAELANAVPNYREINNDDAFQSWLLEADPLTGITRQTYLEDAQQALDARRVANFFRTWLGSNGPASVAQPKGRGSNSELEKQVAPGRSRGAGNPSSTANDKTYTPADIRKFFDDVRTGKYKGREQERDKIERDIFAAQRDGRIVNA